MESEESLNVHFRITGCTIIVESTEMKQLLSSVAIDWNKEVLCMGSVEKDGIVDGDIMFKRHACAVKAIEELDEKQGVVGGPTTVIRLAFSREELQSSRQDCSNLAVCEDVTHSDAKTKASEAPAI